MTLAMALIRVRFKSAWRSAITFDFGCDRIEMGSGLTPDHNHSHPADVLVEGWERGKPAAFDITVTCPLCPAFLGEASGAAALGIETRKKHIANVIKVLRGGLGMRSHCHGDIWQLGSTFSRLAPRLAHWKMGTMASFCKHHYPSVGCAESLHLHLAYRKLHGGQEMGQEQLQATGNHLRYLY